MEKNSDYGLNKDLDVPAEVLFKYLLKDYKKLKEKYGALVSYVQELEDAQCKIKAQLKVARNTITALMAKKK